MTRSPRRHVSTAITLVRVVAAPLAFYFRDNPALFLGFWTICALSDAVDGMIARRLGTASAFGARLDTAADLVSYSVLVLLIFYTVDDLPLLVYWIVAVAIVRLASLAICAWRFRTFGGIHTWGNKITGALFFLLPFYMVLVPDEVWGWTLFVLALASALEELAILLVLPKLDLECPTIWHALQRRPLQSDGS